MTCVSSVTDNVSELLMMIIHFTTLRHKVLQKNLQYSDIQHYQPQDLPVRDFSRLINMALSEHTSHQRLLLYDTDTIKFFPGGDIQIHPCEDPLGTRLHRIDKIAYKSYMRDKLHENNLNQSIAIQLLMKKEARTFSIDDQNLSFIELSSGSSKVENIYNDNDDM